MITTNQQLSMGLIGEHLGSSLSPAIHEAEAAALGLAGFSYQRLDTAQGPITTPGEMLATALSNGFTGFNITHPWKQEIMAYLDALAPEAKALGAVNTVVLTASGTIGHNTDYSGFLSGLRRSLAAGTAAENVVLFGAGGAGSAVAQALIDFGATTLHLIDTDVGRRDSLREMLLAAHSGKSEITIVAGGPDNAAAWIQEADGVINATPLGMEHLPGTPFDVSLLRSTHWVADVIYRPVDTELLLAAAAIGCQRVGGTTMLIEQAADTFVLLTGMEPDRERMRAHLANLLEPAAGAATN
ncbi:shikimate dehydrogenase [Arthrobacter sp. MYb227]|uniref:shikimate dehydrogenase n=1 Tax=Arthrobacter sp. MYb227 TaxID=1848601 RepID=UPI000CFC938A|nr:shikimate dehydrogenase [Arthrobacter sp. MYb227]PQZ94855.1 shikimate dehydrogenase [Arthrobacter sp. MYb227]